MKIISAIVALVAAKDGKVGVKDLPPFAFVRDIDQKLPEGSEPNAIKREQQFEIVATEDPLGPMTWIYNLDSNLTCGPKGSIINVSDQTGQRRKMVFKVAKSAQVGATKCTVSFMKIKKGTTPPAGWWNKPQRKVVMKIDS